MKNLYRVVSTEPLHFSDPLHWSNFFPGKQRLHRELMNRRQDLILFIANLHAQAVRTKMPLGMVHVPMRLMSLKAWCSDYRVVLDAFFDVLQLGYNLGDGNHEISTLVPKKLVNGKRAASEQAASLKYEPGPAPEGKVISKVYIQRQNEDEIFVRLAKASRLDLAAPVEWLLKQAEVNFHFEPAGKLKQRDTSVWPVAGIETWPSWLREALFGIGIDIDSAYTQFLISHLRQIHANEPKMLEMLYPDLLRSLVDKKAWRIELCRDVLGMEPTDENIGTVKRLCMSLANGSRISPGILTGSRAFSITADIVIQATDDVSIENLTRIGKRLSWISQQYVTARKMLCVTLNGLNPNRKNQKLVFASYFEWERVARYMIWEACDRHGVMVHDGIDGIPKEYLDRLPTIMEELGLRLTA